MSTDAKNAPSLRMTWHGRSVVGCVRQNNEDSLWAGALEDAAADADQAHDAATEGSADLVHPGVVLAVADGMGGAKAGEVASGMAVSILRDEMLGWSEGEEAGADQRMTFFIAAVEKANDQIRDAGARDPSRHGMGTTLTAVWLAGDEAQLVHVGDSRAYRFRKGHLEQLTKDQSLVEKLLEDKIISPEEAQNMGGKNIILQALGSEDDLDVAHPHATLAAGDLILLCTDGLNGVVEDGDIEECLRAGGDLDALCSRMIEAAEQAGGPDNITVLLGRVETG